MPELPEVETIKRGLEPHILGRIIEKTTVKLPKQIKGQTVKTFTKALAGQTIRSVGRRAKYLVIGFDDFDLIIHLGMSGQVTFWDHNKTSDSQFVRHPVTGLQKTPSQHEPDKHTHVIFYLNEGDRIQYRDIRQFGSLRIVHHKNKNQFLSFTRLGVEPFGEEYTWENFKKITRQRDIMAKPMLLSQKTVCGLGNIYVDEALHKSGIHPRQNIKRLSITKLKALYAAIPEVLERGIQNKGTSFMNFIGADGNEGHNRESLAVYGRGGEACLNCQRPLKKMLVSQRTTVYCSRCQRLKT